MPLGAFFRIRLFCMNILQYLKEVQTELKEVKFPTTATTITYTVIVIVLSVLVAVGLGAVDLGLREALAKILAR